MTIVEPSDYCKHLNVKRHDARELFQCKDCRELIEVRRYVLMQNERIKKLEEALANFIQ